VGYRVGYSYHE